MKNKNIGFAMCGSFCTMDYAVEQLKLLCSTGANVLPIMSDIVYNTDTRFTKANELKEKVKNITQNEIIHTINAAEPIGPKGLLDLLIICPCTGNTLSKLANGITDSAVCMAAKGHLRNDRPLLLAIATNDALSGSAANIGKLMGTKNIFFVPFGQDDAKNKPTSMICNFESLVPAAEFALAKKQIQPIIIAN
jgi:dipicolinate synthase subunit B